MQENESLIREVIEFLRDYPEFVTYAAIGAGFAYMSHQLRNNKVATTDDIGTAELLKLLLVSQGMKMPEVDQTISVNDVDIQALADRLARIESILAHLEETNV
jgi:hypothetical protein